MNVAGQHLNNKIKNLPQSPGVYKFLGKSGEILYVGKAKNLRARVRQYFNQSDERPQIPYLLKDMTDVDYTVVGSELESLYLENTLIKEYSPKYNIDLKDDKNYAFITIDYSTQIPQIGYARKFDRGNKNLKYFGPYSAAYRIRELLNSVRRIFPYCSATQVSKRPCFYYFLHRCPGVCVGAITVEEYKQQLSKIESFLNGQIAPVRKELKLQMLDAAKTKRFEKAARLRNQLQALEIADERQSVILPKPVFIDVVSFFAEDGFACINLFKIREGKMRDKENFIYELQSRLDSDPAGILQKFLENYYLEASSAPKEIYLQKSVEAQEIVAKLIHDRFGKKIKFCVPQKGRSRSLINLGVNNARECLKNWLAAKAGHLDKINKALEGLKTVLNLTKIPNRIECYDISNIQGTNAVGSMVVFEQGLPKKSEYRKFKIKYSPPAGGPDDFAMMKEMLARRFAHSLENIQTNDEKQISNSPNTINSKSQILNFKSPKWPLPDLIVIDGGKGQLNAALEALNPQRSTLNAFSVIGLAKRIEEIFLPNNPTPIILPHTDPALQLLQRLRDEAHRFGITFHRALRSKQAVKSALDNIKGVGPKTKKLLKQKFGTVADIKQTSFDELKKVVGEKLANTIKHSL